MMTMMWWLFDLLEGMVPIIDIGGVFTP